MLRPAAMITLCAEMARDLNGELAGDAGCAHDENRFSSGEAGALLQRDPCRHAGIGNGRSRHVVQAIGNGDAPGDIGAAASSAMVPQGLRTKTK